MISFCCPSRGRPELAKRLVDTATATQKYDTEFLFYLNDDDETLEQYKDLLDEKHYTCLLYTSPSPRDRTRSRMPSSA